jgi:hypothetical protein
MLALVRSICRGPGVAKVRRLVVGLGARLLSQIVPSITAMDVECRGENALGALSCTERLLDVVAAVCGKNCIDTGVLVCLAKLDLMTIRNKGSAARMESSKKEYLGRFRVLNCWPSGFPTVRSSVKAASRPEDISSQTISRNSNVESQYARPTRDHECEHARAERKR